LSTGTRGWIGGVYMHAAFILSGSITIKEETHIAVDTKVQGLKCRVISSEEYFIFYHLQSVT
jgi:hypothetical protein